MGMRADKLKDLLIYRKALEGIDAVSDRHFAHYLVIARGSALETRAHLATARQRQHIWRDEEIAVSGLYQDLADMLSGFIAYLRRCDRKDRW
jgi:four helix bundle protein